jgi:integral membrane sensor domain MASE1
MADLFKAIWERVVVHWVPTLIGIAAAAGLLVLDKVTEFTQSQGWPSWVVNALAAVIALAGAYLKGKAKEPPAP